MAESEATEKGRPRTILLVQSNEALRTASRELLEGFGHEVLTAADSREALESAAGHPRVIDLAVVEAFPRSGSGLDLIRALRRDRPQLRALLLSAFGEDPELRAAVERREAVTLAVPFSTAGLRHAVAAALGTPAPATVHRLAAPSRPARRRSVPAWALAAAATLAGVVLLFPWLDRAAPPPLRGARERDRAVRDDPPGRPTGRAPGGPDTLRWESVPGAASYRVDVRGVDGRVLWEAKSDTAEVAVDPLVLSFVPAVRYSWRVEALDAEGRPLASSPRVWILVRPPSPPTSSSP
ncbi:MAG: response regulator [Thermoanaerobaculia bacterium]